MAIHNHFFLFAMPSLPHKDLHSAGESLIMQLSFKSLLSPHRDNKTIHAKIEKWRDYFGCLGEDFTADQRQTKLTAVTFV